MNMAWLGCVGLEDIYINRKGNTGQYFELESAINFLLLLSFMIQNQSYAMYRAVA